MTPLYLVVFGISLFSSLVLTRYVRNLAMGLGWVAPPLQERDLHTTALPRYGGVAIFLSFLLSIAVALFATTHLLAPGHALSIRVLITILVSGTLIFLLGVYDDIRSVGPYFKFAVQAVAAIILFAGGLRIFDIPVLFGHWHFGWPVSLSLTILWVIGITNAFNLIDGLDGLAAGSALFSTLVVFVVALFSGSSLVSLLTIALAGAILGFLRFNFNPATIFLGDCGSLFIGFMLSALALQGAKSPTVVAVAIPVVSFGLPILETVFSVLRRFIGGRPVFTGDREHIHHKLLQRGLSQREVVILLYGVSGLFALLSLFLLWPTGSTLGLVLAVLGTGVWLGVQHLGYLEFWEIRRVARRTIEQRSIFVNNLFIRRATEELKGTRDYLDLCRILRAAFCENDFDGFMLNVGFPEVNGGYPSPIQSTGSVATQFEWSKPGCMKLRDSWSAWKLTLQLVDSRNRDCGSMEIYRLYNDRPLLVDINLLTSVFPIVLADALSRTLAVEVPPEAETQIQFRAAEAG